MKPGREIDLEGDALARLKRVRVMPFWAPIMREIWDLVAEGSVICFSRSAYLEDWICGVEVSSAQAIEKGWDIHQEILGM